MPKIQWKVRQVPKGYQALVKVTSDLLKEESGQWFTVEPVPFETEVSAQTAAQEAAYRLGLKLASKELHSPATGLIIEKSE